MRMFFATGISIALFLELLLVSKKNKSESDKVLTLWMFLILLHLFLFVLYSTGDIFDFPFLLGVEHPLPLLQGVFLYLYVSLLTDQAPKNRKILILHFVPAALMYVYLITFFILPGEEKIQVYRNHGAGHEVFIAIKWYCVACSGVFYVIWSALLLRRHSKNIRNQFSDVHKINLRWLQILTFGLGAIWLMVIFLHNDTMVFSGVVVFVFLIGFFGVRQADIFRHTPSTLEEIEPRGKYQKSGLTEEASGELLRELKRLMTEEALYKKSDLSIDELSSRLGVHPNYLSQTINQNEKKNFYDFVNAYRIEEFKRLIEMHKNQQFTLLSLAYDCGFSSKTSFNRCFKKVTGQTPSEYVAAFAGTQLRPS